MSAPTTSQEPVLSALEPISSANAVYMSTVQVRAVYRGLVRELARHHEHARVKFVEETTKDAAARAKLAARSGKVQAPPDQPQFPRFYDTTNFKALVRSESLPEKDVREIVKFLSHQRKYKELLDRYQTGIADNEERVRLSARRVGLDVDKL